MDGLEWIESMFSFETQKGRGSGMMRIVQGADGTWKGYMMYTIIKELKGFEESTGSRRSHGGNNSLLGGTIKGNWQERRERQLEFIDEEPQVVVIGAGKNHCSPPKHVDNGLINRRSSWSECWSPTTGFGHVMSHRGQKSENWRQLETPLQSEYSRETCPPVSCVDT